MKTVGIGVIGVGQFGSKHIAAFSALPNAEVVAVFDIADLQTLASG